MRRKHVAFSARASVASAVLMLITAASAADADRPNVVLIMTDNHGAWTLGCYGNRDIRTPNIDRLAAGGMLFTRALSSNAVCSPTRATYLTGLMPSQHGVHCFLRSSEAQIGPDAYSTIAEFRTLPEILHEAGYVCGLSGKWHLGLNMKPHEGFSFWITKPHGGTAEFYDQEVIENGEIRREPMYLTEMFTQRGIEFIRQSKERPFFLFLAYNGPYGLSSCMLNPPRNRHAEFYADKLFPSFPREAMHPWLYSTQFLFNQVDAMRRYAAEISGIDDGVGRVMETLAELGLDENTLVIFTADQGLAGGQSGFWGMGDHTRPLTAYDWTMSVPLIVRQPGRVPAGRRRDEMVSNYDLLPTLLDYLDLKNQRPSEPELPGRSFAPLLEGESSKWENVVYYEFENVRSVRTEDRKYIERFPDGPNELFDLAADPGERHNLVDRVEHAAERDRLAIRLHTFFDRYADPKYDLWHGGGSKTRLLSAPEVEAIPGRAGTSRGGN